MRPLFLIVPVLLLMSCVPDKPQPDIAVLNVSGSASTIVWDEAAAIQSLPKTKKEWLERMTKEEYRILFEQATERPFTSPLTDEKRKGTYVSADCGQPLFRSEQKFDSTTGWPRFWAPITADSLVLETDMRLGYPRTEVRSKCGGHLGHVFADGPQPTGLRFCINGLALKFIPDTEQ